MWHPKLTTTKSGIKKLEMSYGVKRILEQINDAWITSVTDRQTEQPLAIARSNVNWTRAENYHKKLVPADYNSNTHHTRYQPTTKMPACFCSLRHRRIRDGGDVFSRNNWSDLTTKLVSNIYHVNGQCRKVLSSHRSKVKVKVVARPNSVMTETCISTVWSRG